MEGDLARPEGESETKKECEQSIKTVAASYAAAILMQARLCDHIPLPSPGQLKARGEAPAPSTPFAFRRSRGAACLRSRKAC